MDASITGRCLCGSVTYSADTEPMVVALCHCDDCQRQSGAAFSVNVLIDRAALVIEGDSLRTYETVGADSGQPRERIFCSTCGSSLMTILAERENVAVLKAGTLDDKSWVSPNVELFTDFEHPWVAAGGGPERARFPRSLPA
jgi:hypothetical protein